MKYKTPKPFTPTQPPVTNAIERHDDNGEIWVIPFDPANTDYQAYLKWLAEGNQPLPADVIDPLPAVQAEAKQRLADTDWSQVADVASALQNKSAFDAYRSAVRDLYFNPVAAPVWPERPEAVWSV